MIGRGSNPAIPHLFTSRLFTFHYFVIICAPDMRFAPGIPLRFVTIFVLCACLCQCRSQMAAWQVGRTNDAAEDRILLIQRNPPSMGYQRLVNQRVLHPEFASWLDQMGMPEFMAEKTLDEHHYMVLYYLSRKQAYSCRTSRHYSSERMAISGPLNITPREQHILRDFRSDALTPRRSVLQHP